MAVIRACALVGMVRSSYYRAINPSAASERTPVPQAQRYQPAALTQAERDRIVEVLCEPEHAGLSVVQAYWAAFDAGTVSCSQRTFYRVAGAAGLVGDRRPVRRCRHGRRPAPAAWSRRPHELWSWDVTQLSGPGRDRYYLFLVLDVFSRYPIAWRVETTETQDHAVGLFTDAIERFGPPQVLHADNGAIQRGHDLIDLLTNAGAITSYSRPRVSDDNPFSESLFKTIKYTPDCPGQFDNVDHARAWTGQFLHRYATEHRHSALGRHTPSTVLDGTAQQVQARRQARLDTYYAEHPERFSRRPTPPKLPRTTGINTHQLSQAA